MRETAIGRVDPAVAADSDAMDLRRVMRRFPTGVVVVAASRDGRPHGMAVNSFASVSLRPPLVMFCADRSSTTWPAVRAAGGFAVSVLSEDQVAACRRFAEKGADRFAGTPWRPTRSGHPMLDEAVAWLDCAITDVVVAGDHDIVVARVLSSLDGSSCAPLVFHGGELAGLRMSTSHIDRPERRGRGTWWRRSRG